MKMSEMQGQTVQMLLQFFQLVALLIGCAGIFMSIGRRDANITTNSEEITELRDIASSLLRTSIESTTTNRDQDRRLNELRDRVARLESSK